MSRVRSKNTAPEKAVRRIAYAMGYHYRLHAAGLPGKPCLVFPARRKVIFVHGCFWHRHADPTCRRARLPKSSAAGGISGSTARRCAVTFLVTVRELR